jgi:hypothetical protein
MFGRVSATFVVLLLAAASVSATPYTEVVDAGFTLPTAQDTGTASPLTSISGFLAANDVDIFRIHLGGGSFRISLVPGDGGTADFDTQLFLFDALGFGVLANDDRPPTLFSRVNGSLPAGTYYVAISAWDLDPVSAGGLIFPSQPYSGMFGPTGPGGSQPLSGWQGLGTGGYYRIALEGVDGSSVVPEPGTLLLVGSGLSALALSRRRKK